MGDGASKMACYGTQRDEEVEHAVALFGRRRRGISFLAGSPTTGHKSRAIKPGPPPSCDMSDTVIIFDWDDTLLCSAAINAHQYTTAQLKCLEKAVEAVLTLAMALGETLIVTNGNRTWVEESSKRYLPGLQPLLSQLRVFSARAMYENAYPGDPFVWKRMAFREILAQRQGESLAPMGVNLVVIGDSCVEMEAARSSLKVVTGQSLVKTVKFKEVPTAHELLGQLRKVSLELTKIVQTDHKLSRYLIPRILPAHLDHLHSWAAGWQITDGHTRFQHIPVMLQH